MTPVTQIAGGLQFFRMPAQVDSGAWACVLSALEALPSLAGVRCVLDFTSSVHIRYPDLQRFAQTVRERLRPTRPVLLIGLSPYCGEIVRFALRAEDWDLFQEAERVVAIGRAWGNAGPMESSASSGRDAQDSERRRVLPLPSVN